ncbi:MAG: site-specific DNA-methyltransferase [Actinomycetota bacterium]|nr:site-specific DNA-methyltransferase [Actinomycetota bacterium]
MTYKHSGALELTWTNKHLRLLAHDDSVYEWVEPSDFRVSEVRLLNTVCSVGEVHSERERAKDNLLIRGDSLHGLTSLVRLPEFAAEYKGKVKLVYIDPPFNTGQAFTHYDDGLEHSVWLTMLRDRLEQIKALLSPDGSVWVHLDDTEQHRARVVLDEIFGQEGFVSTIIWQKVTGRDNRTAISQSHDYIHVYSRAGVQWMNIRNLMPRSDEASARYSNADDDPRGPWTSGDLSAKAGPGRRASQFYTITLPSGRRIDPPAGRCWLFTRDRFDEMLSDNRIWFGPDGNNVPRLKRFLSEVQDGLVPMTLWPTAEVGSNDGAKKEIKDIFPGLEPFSTPKPERLMERIIHIGSNPGDIVLDCFAGSGTTAAVAHKMARRWVTIEWSANNIADFTLPRLGKVVKGEDPGGVTESTGWEGGGGFRLLDVAPSVYEVSGASILLADNVTAGELAESVAAQLGFTYELDGAFCGRKNKMRLAVIDGVLSDDIVRLLAGALADGERVTVVATAAEAGAEDLLRSLSPGSRARKVPRDLARLSRRRSEKVQLILDGLESQR